MRKQKRTSVSQNDNKFLFAIPSFFFSKEKARPKGQWFIISAVIASGVFLGLSMLLKDYFIIDSSSYAMVNNDYYFYNTLDQFRNVVSDTPTYVSCINLTTNLDEFRAFTQKELAAKGLFVFMNYTVTPPCNNPNTVKLDLLIASENGLLYNFSSYVSPKQVIGAA
jgi:hypothetical protein